MAQKPAPKADLLAEFAQAESDSEVLRMFHQALLTSKDRDAMTALWGPIERSITRADRDAARIREQYERGTNG